eukprot:SAG31_NODE_16712_length_699_cov_0.598333_1_plen_35_part_10
MREMLIVLGQLVFQLGYFNHQLRVLNLQVLLIILR